MKPGHLFRYAILGLSSLGLCAGRGGTAAAQEAAGESESVLLQPGSARAFTLAPGASRSVTVYAGAGEAVTAVFEQAAGSISVTESCTGCPPREPRTNAAGVHSSVVFRILGGEAGALSFAVLNPSKTKSAEVVATLGLSQAAGDADRLEADAESSFAHAEALRAKRDPQSADRAAAAYDHAIVAWREAGDTADATRALAWKAMLLGFVKNDPAAAQAIARQALESVDTLSGAEAANCWKIAGYVAAAGADYDSAEKDYTAALALFKDTGDRLNQEILLDNKAKLARQQGRSDEALADAEDAAKIAREIGDLQRQLSIDEELGSIYAERGELRPAFGAYQSALELLKTTSYGPVEGYVWSDLGVLYTLVHEFDRADQSLGKATAFWEKHPNLQGQINTLDDLGELYLEEGKPARARAYLAQGLAVADAHALPRQQVYLLRAIGGSDLRANRLLPAREALLRALTIALQAGQGDALAAVYCSLGDLSAAQKMWPEATQRYAACLKAAAEARSQYDVIHAEGGLARAGLETRALEEALTHADAAIADIESVRGHLSEQDLKTSYFASMHDYYDLDIAIRMRLDRRHPGGGFACQAFQMSERARARMLLDQLRAGGVETGPASGSLSLAAIQKTLLDRRTALLEYWIGGRSSVLWVITRDAFHSYPLPPAAVLAQDAAGLRRDIFRSSAPPASIGAELRDAAMREAESSLARNAERVGGHLLPPPSLLRGVHRLLVVEDGAALSVPFAALRYPAATGERSMPLASQFAIVSEPSASVLAQLIGLADTSRPDHPADRNDATRWKIAIFTNPASVGPEAQVKPARTSHAVTFGTASPSPSAASSSRFDIGTERGLPPLRYAEREAASIVAIYGSTRTSWMTGSNASAASVKALDWGPYAIGHFATHAIVDERHAELSGLALPASGLARGRTGMLWYGEISRMHTPLQLVVLSACDTANGEQVPGEGPLGLSHAFMAAGLQRVLGTLWKVDDEATAAWMALFYRYLKQSNSPADALRQTQGKMAADPRWHSPYFWAGFSLEGNWHAIP